MKSHRIPFIFSKIVFLAFIMGACGRSEPGVIHPTSEPTRNVLPASSLKSEDVTPLTEASTPTSFPQDANISHPCLTPVVPEGAYAQLGTGGVGMISPSPDGKTVAISTPIGIYLCSANLSTQIWSSPITWASGNLAWSPNGQYIATGLVLEGMTIIILDASNGQIIYTLRSPGYYGTWSTIIWSEDGLTVNAAGRDSGTSVLWNVLTGNVLGIVKNQCDMMSLTEVSMSPNSRIIAASPSSGISGSGTIVLWNAVTGECLQTIHTEAVVRQFSWSPDSQRLAVDLWDDSIILYDTPTGKRQFAFQSAGYASGMQWSPNGKMLIYSASETIHVWDTTTGARLYTYENKPYSAMSPRAFLPGNIVVSSSEEGAVIVWDLTSGQSIRAIGSADHEDPIIKLAWSPDAKTLASMDTYGAIILWYPGGEQQPFFLDKSSISSFVMGFYATDMEWSPNGDMLATIGNYSSFFWYDVQKKEGIPPIDMDGMDVNTTLAWSPDGKTIAVGSTNCKIKIWDVTTKQLQQTLQGHSDRISSITWSPDGREIASGSWDNTVTVWNVDGGEQRLLLQGHSQGVVSVAWSPDGRTIASSGGDALIILWDAITGERLHEINRVYNQSGDIVWSPDSRMLATTAFIDGNLTIWDVSTGEILESIQAPVSINTLDWSPDGRFIASADNVSILLWDMSELDNK